MCNSIIRTVKERPLSLNRDLVSDMNLIEDVVTNTDQNIQDVGKIVSTFSTPKNIRKTVLSTIDSPVNL